MSRQAKADDDDDDDKENDTVIGGFDSKNFVLQYTKDSGNLELGEKAKSRTAA